MLRRNVPNYRCQRSRRIHVDAQIAHAVAGNVIESRADDQQIRTHDARDRGQQVLPQCNEAFGGDSGNGHGSVDDQIVRSAITLRAGTRISRIGVGRNIGEAVAGNGFGAVTVMIVEVHDENAAAEAGLERACRDRDVVKEAEAHPSGGFGMVARWANQRKNRFFSSDAGLHGRNRAAGSATSNAKGARVHERITGRKISRIRYSGGLAPHEFDIRRRVHPRELLVASVASGEGVDEHALRSQASPDLLDAIGPLGMDYAAQMIPVEGIDDDLQPECLVAGDLHGPAAAFTTIA